MEWDLCGFVRCVSWFVFFQYRRVLLNSYQGDEVCVWGVFHPPQSKTKSEMRMDGVFFAYRACVRVRVRRARAGKLQSLLKKI
ncbi:MAG TPA: hypothetical protein PLX02_15600, partial [Syntrophorhabdaceae bacterium]|nr:hypothetical protein [Syntrophorhabdaceae bacterium]